ncbi:ABC transporter permease [Bacillus niameyensis]|uniref:ABC transporter permease n=1 Tax=Bacillus niameyensis TaxID=1522308 RepID=UPI000784CF90|nr:ABC transporter permease [Bacillus niameyensis]
MTLFDLAKKNLKKNTKQYLLYFYPMVLSVVIYFTFVSLQYNRQIIESATVLGKVEPAFLAASVMLLIFSAIFIWYSNSFFTRKRKKEVALYSLFGMRKKQVAKLLFYENLITGFVALLVGIVIGALLSKLFTMLLIKLMGFSLNAHFELSVEAVFQTFIVFAGIIGLTSAHNYLMIYRYTLIDLLKADKQGDKQRRGSKVAALLSLLFLGAGYYVLLLPVDAGIYKEMGFTAVLISLLLILIGTFLFIHSAFITLLEWIGKMGRIYFKGTNLISVSHLRFRMKGNVLILSVIASLTTLTLFVLGAIFGFQQNINDELSKTYPLSIMYTSQSEESDARIEKLIKESGDHPIVFAEQLEYLELEGDLSASGRWFDHMPLMLISEEDYKRLAGKMGLNPISSIGQDGAIVFNDGDLNRNYDPYTGKDVLLYDQGKVKIEAYEKDRLLNLDYSTFQLVIANEKYEQLKEHAEMRTMQIYKLKNEKKMETLTAAIEKEFYDNIHDEFFQFSSFYQEYQKGIQTYGLLIFIGAFLGIVFILATGSMLYYKQLTEATADQGRYKILRKIGMGRKQMKGAIAKQLLPVFLLPLIIAIPNSSVIMTALARFTHMNMFLPFLTMIGIYIVIYFGYYVITYKKYDSIVNH